MTQIVSTLETDKTSNRFLKKNRTGAKKTVIYPESDGKPMSDNTKQFEWIVKIKEGLEILFADRSDVFVAGDLLWYPVEGNNKIRAAPDAMVAFGIPKGHRGSYLQWKEGDIPPQVVFEVLSPGNRPMEMKKKLRFYERYGVEEYYVYDPDRIMLEGWIRSDGKLSPVEDMKNWTSPMLKILFELTEDDLYIYRPDGRKFLTFSETELKAEQAEAKAEQERLRAEMLEAKLKALESRLSKERIPDHPWSGVRQ